MTKAARIQVRRQHKREGWIQNNSTTDHQPRSTMRQSTAFDRIGYPRQSVNFSSSRPEQQESPLTAGRGRSPSYLAHCHMAHRTRYRCTDLPPRRARSQSSSSLQSSRLQVGTFASKAPLMPDYWDRHRLLGDSTEPMVRMRWPGMRRTHL